jgi:hypothetical protein
VKEKPVNNKTALGFQERWLATSLIKVDKGRRVCNTKRVEPKLLKHQFVSSMLQSWRVEQWLHQ